MMDLHAHITGSLKAEHIFDFIISNGIHKKHPDINKFTSFIGEEIGSSSREAFISKYSCCPNGTKRFNEIMQRFVLISFLLKLKPDWLSDIGEIVARDFKEQYIDYVEWRIDPFSSNDGSAKAGEHKIRTVFSGLSKVSINSKIVLSVAKNRYFVDTENSIRYLADETRRLLENIKDIPVVGLDLSNNENVPISKFKDYVDVGCDYGLKFVPHAGEGQCASIEDDLTTIEDAINLGAVRIGHGIAAYRDLDDYLNTYDGNNVIYDFNRISKLESRQQDILSRLKENNIIIEVCPTSNLSAHLGYNDMFKHPICRLYKFGLKCIICSDDFGIFNSSLADEIYKSGLILNRDY